MKHVIRTRKSQALYTKTQINYNHQIPYGQMVLKISFSSLTQVDL